jgi:TPP-dependent pyruvate/acetoin dehydrogenase alpha subunit
VYRLGPHSTSDDPKRYRTDADLAQWKAKDPLALVKHELRSTNSLSEADDQQIWDAAKSQIAQALQEAEATAPVAPGTLFEDVFAAVPPGLARQREEFEELIQKGVLRP